MNDQLWASFQQLNKNRRAVKHFTPEEISSEDLHAILSEGLLAPSSFNLQPYELHCVKDKELCKKMSEACEDQRAAASATAFIVVVAKWQSIKEHCGLFLHNVETNDAYDARSKAYFLRRRKDIDRFVRFLPLRIFGGLKSLVSLFTRHMALTPLGKTGMHQWAARNSIFAAQTVLLAASARGIDSCPMEGFSPSKVAKTLGIKQGVISLVIALGKQDRSQPLTPHWRQPFEKMVVMH